MEETAMKKLFNFENNYYNTLLSSESLDIDHDYVHSITSRDEIIKTSKVFLQLMKKLIVVLIAGSIMLLLLVMFLVVRIIIDRQSVSISMFKIFVYHSREVERIFLSNNIIIVILATLIFLPITKWMIKKIYPFLVANRTLGFNLEFSARTYFMMFILVLLSYGLSYWSAKRKLKRIDFMDVLKER